MVVTIALKALQNRSHTADAWCHAAVQLSDLQRAGPAVCEAMQDHGSLHRAAILRNLSTRPGKRWHSRYYRQCSTDSSSTAEHRKVDHWIKFAGANLGVLLRSV